MIPSAKISDCYRHAVEHGVVWFAQIRHMFCGNHLDVEVLAERLICNN